MPLMDAAISSFSRKTLSRSILGTDDRTTSSTYDSICARGLVSLYIASWMDWLSPLTWYWTATLMPTKTLSLVFVSALISSIWMRVEMDPLTNWQRQGSTQEKPASRTSSNLPQRSTTLRSSWEVMTQPQASIAVVESLLSGRCLVQSWRRRWLLSQGNEVHRAGLLPEGPCVGS